MSARHRLLANSVTRKCNIAVDMWTTQERCERPIITTRAEKIRKLRALGRSPNEHEAARALQKARELESRMPTAKGIALAIVALLETRGLRLPQPRWLPWAQASVSKRM